MNDKWINIGYDGEDLKPHMEPVEDLNNTSHIGEKYRHFTVHLFNLIIDVPLINCCVKQKYLVSVRWEPLDEASIYQATD